MKETMTERELLEWYITAGVDCICGDEPWVQLEKSKSVSFQKNPVKTVEQCPDKQEEIPLSQTIVSACQNACQICMKVETLDELKA